MKISDVIKQLQKRIPQLTDLFTDETTISTLTRSGAVVTAVTTVDHNLITGDTAVITGAVEVIPITSLTLSGQTVTAVLSSPHDLTVPGRQQLRDDNLFAFNKVNISGVDQSEYNGEFIVIDTPDRTTFKYTIIGTPAAPTGTPVYSQTTEYNGLKTITLIDPTTFTYPIVTTPVSPAGGLPILNSAARISGALSLNRAIDIYTPQADDNSLWCFVVADNDQISRDRGILSDATQEIAAQNEYRVRQIEPFIVYLFIPATSSLTGIAFQDLAEDLREVFYRSLLGVNLPTVLSCVTFSMITPLGDRFVFEASNDAVYIHEYRFERVTDITFKDTKGPDDNIAFQTVGMTFVPTGGTEVEELTTDFQLDP